MKKNHSIILFVFSIIGISVYYNYHKIVIKRPQSIHKWRQSDCASIALNYYQGGMRFFQPETHNLTSDGGTTGKVCTSEIPILYYSAAFLYKVFGYHDWVYRLFSTLLFFIGLYYLFRFLLYRLKDTFWSISLTALFFTSPVLVYYGNNFLSNSSALSFVFMGWYFFIKYSDETKAKYLLVSMVAFLLAASFKVSALFSVFAIAGVYFLELGRLQSFVKEGKLFKHSSYFIISVLVILVIVGSWIVYAHNFNQKHDTTYFSTTIFPIWDYEIDSIKSILKQINKVWVPEYFHWSALVFLAICLIFVFTNYKKTNALLLFTTIFLLAEALLYFVLQFWTFADHDYYTIDLYILPVIVVITTFELLKSSYPKLFNSPVSKIIFSSFLIFNIYYAHQRLNQRYASDSWMNNTFEENKDIYSITPYLRKIGIIPKDTVVSIPDGSHVSLYLMNQKGWTEYTDAKFMRGEPVRYNQDSAGIKSSIEKGAKYLIVNGIEQFYKKPYLQAFDNYLKGNYNNVLIFDLKSKESNFSLKERHIASIIKCGAETLNQDRSKFLGEADSILFEGGATQNSDFSHDGQFSAKLNSESPFGMTVKLDSLKNGESFEISVWRKSEKKLIGHLIASSEPHQFYNNKFKVVETDSSGWEKLYMDFFIPSELEGQELAIYVYNPEEDPVYFDDIEIIRYKSIFEIDD